VPCGLSPWEHVAYLAQQLCACGVVGCPQRTIGLVVTRPCTPEAWQHQAQAYTRAQKRWLDERA
jgi:hypothetical protein